MAKIFYNSVHSVLEYDEIKLFTELGHSVFSSGAYLQPAGHADLPRPGIPGASYFPELEAIARHSPRTEMPKELIDPFDIFIFMHGPNVLEANWPRIRHKKGGFRSIGQNPPDVEDMLAQFRAEGLKIVRYSPKEELLPHYCGQDAMIRFYKDPDDWKDWNGNNNVVINHTPTLKGRRTFCHYDEIYPIVKESGGKIYGTGNEDLGTLNGGNLPYEDLKQAIRDARVFIYGGTWPAAYTLSFIEAWMTGIPMVCIGKKLAEQISYIPKDNRFQFYEIPNLIQNE